MERASQRGSLDRFEQEKQSFFKKVRQGYLDIAAAEPERCQVIDASKPLEQVKVELLTALKQGLSRINN
jgi:dTMP kinase